MFSMAQRSLDRAVVLDVAQPGAGELGAAADVDALQDGEALQEGRQLCVTDCAGRAQVRQHTPADCVVKLQPEQTSGHSRNVGKLATSSQEGQRRSTFPSGLQVFSVRHAKELVERRCLLRCDWHHGGVLDVNADLSAALLTRSSMQVCPLTANVEWMVWAPWAGGTWRHTRRRPGSSCSMAGSWLKTAAHTSLGMLRSARRRRALPPFFGFSFRRLGAGS